MKHGPASDGGISKWLERYAPEINRPTAYRFENVAKAVQEQFKLPEKTRKSLGFAGLATADAGKLSEKERKLQQGILRVR